MPEYGKVYVQHCRRIQLTNGKYITRERSAAEVGWLSAGNEGPCPIWTEDLDRIAIAKTNEGLSRMGKPPRQSAEIYPGRAAA